MNWVDSPGAMLNEFQLRTALWEASMARCVPETEVEAVPVTTVGPAGLARPIGAWFVALRSWIFP